MNISNNYQFYIQLSKTPCFVLICFPVCYIVFLQNDRISWRILDVRMKCRELSDIFMLRIPLQWIFWNTSEFRPGLISTWVLWRKVTWHTVLPACLCTTVYIFQLAFYWLESPGRSQFVFWRILSYLVYWFITDTYWSSLDALFQFIQNFLFIGLPVLPQQAICINLYSLIPLY